MNILIVSFDRNLVKKLRDVLSQYNVIDVKNGEEAINTTSSYVDVIVYDAISGSISEDDINNMYKQKFKDSKYIVLVDDLFPVDMNNILPPRKIKLARDEAVDKILSVLQTEITEIQEVIPEEILQVETSAGVQKPNKLPEGEIILEKLPFIGEEELSKEMAEVDKTKQKERLEEVEVEGASMQTQIPPSMRKLLIVSFDNALINSIKEQLGDLFQIEEARNMKEATTKAYDADIILFDTISGMLAQKTLMEMSKEEGLSSKPFILLIDELFTIDVDNIPLPRKYAYGREAELSKAIDKVIELSREVQEVYPLMEKPASEEVAELPPPEEEVSIMELLEGLMSSVKEEKVEEVIEKQPVMEAPKEEEHVEKPQEKILPSLPLENVAQDLANVLKSALSEHFSPSTMQSIISSMLDKEELRRSIISSIEGVVEEVIREQVARYLSAVNVEQILREETYKALKERLSELIS